MNLKQTLCHLVTIIVTFMFAYVLMYVVSIASIAPNFKKRVGPLMSQNM